MAAKQRALTTDMTDVRINPEGFPRRILLAVTGLSPQVVTETIYALAVAAAPGSERFVPTEVHVLSTVRGAEQARLTLLSRDPGWFHRLRAEYELPEIAFDESHVHVLQTTDGRPLEDIRTPQDNHDAADFITEWVRALTADEDAALHVSLAGGRKTMGFFLGYALSLFGRPQDRLSHVLVSEPYEASGEFFYPTRESRSVELRPKLFADLSKARVELAGIPFVPLRHGLESRLLSRRTSYNTLVDALKVSLAPPELIVDPRAGRIRASGMIVPLSPTEFALYAVAARRVQNGGKLLEAPVKLDRLSMKNKDWSPRFLREVRSVWGEMRIPPRLEETLTRGVNNQWFSEHVSRLNRRLSQALGQAAHHYRLRKPRRDDPGYGINLSLDQIRFEEIAT